MLLADAVLDGYEPIEVSSDIEEGWSALDDGVKQVFLYDDFLGRTALSERFAKNEDRRLIDFMRRATRSPASLFILTTREYILRQATELYERLSQEGLDSDRFLLELPDYTSLDRARIFANYVFHSPHLSKAFRRALLVDKSYEKIIYHANYNPRTIELITGLAKRWDDTVTPDNYVDYALRTRAPQAFDAERLRRIPRAAYPQLGRRPPTRTRWAASIARSRVVQRAVASMLRRT